MREFTEFLRHVGALLDSGGMSRRDAAYSVARYIQQELVCSQVAVWGIETIGEERVMTRIAAYDGVAKARLNELLVLRNRECEAYFEALTSKGVYVSHDAHADDNLRSMRDSYLVPHDVRSKLDVVIGFNGTPRSVISCTQVGAVRQWLPREIQLVKRFAAEVSVRRARRKAREAEVAMLMERLSKPKLQLSEPPEGSA